MARLSKDEELDRAKQARAKAEQDVRRAAKAIKEQDRKADTRRKIILGAAVLDAAGKDRGASRFIRRQVELLKRDADKAAFEGFELPAPPPPPADDEPEPGQD